ncbi:MAG: sugar phosphate isomerase/epimerase [Spirochaetes bacterium]|nr:sugar phosphate isomerase/epimerase [Spirochaetota bacterium]
MKIGMCMGVENIGKVEAMGFDYIEPSIVSLTAMTDEVFKKTKETVAASGIKCEACNVLFPGDIKVVGPVVDKAKISAHLEKGFSRAAELGTVVVVFGSGGARKCPDGFDFAKAVEQYIEVARMAGDIAGKYGITIVVEPLNKSETNIINTVSEGVDVTKRIAHPSVKLLADLFHMRKENESMDIIRKAGADLKHVHVINSNGRVLPAVKDEDCYADFFAALKSINYTGRASIEGKSDNFDAQGTASLKLLREMSAGV